MGRDALIKENERLRKRIAQLEKQISNYGRAREYLRQEQYDREQSERGKWGIYG